MNQSVMNLSTQNLYRKIHKPKNIQMNKSKSAITFQEFKNKMNDANDFENDWGHFVDIDTHTHTFNMKQQEQEQEQEKERKNHQIIETYNSKEINIFNVVLNYIFTDPLKLIMTINFVYIIFYVI